MLVATLCGYQKENGMTKTDSDEVRQTTRSRKFWICLIIALAAVTSILSINMILAIASFAGISRSLSSPEPEALTVEWPAGLWTMRYTLESDGKEMLNEDNVSWEVLTKGLRTSFFSSIYIRTHTGGCRIVYLRQSILDKFTEHCIRETPFPDAVTEALTTGRNKIHEQAQIAAVTVRKYERALKNLPQE